MSGRNAGGYTQTIMSGLCGKLVDLKNESCSLLLAGEKKCRIAAHLLHVIDLVRDIANAQRRRERHDAALLALRVD